MRYENWDVLLFPETSKVPIREFKTQCAVAQSKESPYTADPSLMSPQASYVPQTNAGLVPVLTTYIPSLAENTAFRVSIHSWERPRPSRLMENLMQPDDALLFMAQVYIDGDPVSTCVFGQRTSWPHVIEYSPHIDRDGNQEPLRFPLFHREMLEQSRWGASDLNGRIVIMITEGFARPNRSPPIERVRDLIAFSFLHAPQNILEMCNVAWPNPSIWSNTAQPFRFNPSISYRDFKVPEDPHTHSPAKHESRTTFSRNQIIDPPLYNNWAYKSYPTPLQWSPSYNPRWCYPEQYIADPFADAYTAVNHNGARSYRDDISMPDWKSASSSSRAISNMTGISYEHSKQPSCVGVPGDERYDRVFRPYSPPKEPPIRQTLAPAPMAVHPTMLPPMGYRSSAAPGAHLVSLAKNTGHRTLASGLKDMPPPPGSRDVSVSSTKCNAPFQSSVEDESIEFYSGPDAHAKGKSSITILDDEQDGVTTETPRKESIKINYTPTKTTARSGEGTDPDKDPGIPSIGSSRGEFVPGSKPVAAAITPTKDQAPANGTDNSSGSNDSDDQIEQISFDDFAKSTLRIRDGPLPAVMNSSHYWNQTVLPQAFSGTNNEQHPSYHWGYTGGSNSAYFGSYPWITGAGGAIFPIFATSAFYPSSSSATLQASSGTGDATVNTSTNTSTNTISNASNPSQSVVVLKEEQEQRPSSSAPADQAARFLATIPAPHVVESRERAEPTQDSPRLASLDLRELDASEAVFYFGVLAIQSLLLPRFQYSQDQNDRKWGCTLTMYGHTIVKPHLFDSQGMAKAEACREALKTLVPQFPEWIVPREPEESLVASVGWNWVELLQDYCIHNGLRQPHYTQYTHENNYRHEVELEGGSFFGLQKKYSDARDSQNAAAHMGLHGLLVHGSGVPYSFPGPFTLKRSHESLLAHVPRRPPGDRADTSTTPYYDSAARGTKRGSSDDHYASGPSPQGRTKKTRTRGGRRAKRGSASKETVLSAPPQCKNANLLPLGENRLPDLDIHELEEKRRWHLTPGQIQDRLKNLWTQNARLEITLVSFHDWKGARKLIETCQLLSLQRPEIRVERTDGRLVEGEGEYSAAAYFQGDPFLTRAGAIGSIKGVHQSEMAARESCAGEVVKYLLRMVNEDTILEAEEAAKREQPEQWRENILKVYVDQGILDPEAVVVSE